MSLRRTGSTIISWAGSFCLLVPQSGCYLGRVKRIWYLSPMRAAKVQASLRIRAVSPEPSLLAHTSSESRGTFRQKARSLTPLNGWARAVKICHDGMFEDTNSFDAAHFMWLSTSYMFVALVFPNHDTGEGDRVQTDIIFNDPNWVISYFYMSRSMIKPAKCLVRPSKTQISLGIRLVWSESLLSA